MSQQRTTALPDAHDPSAAAPPPLELEGIAHRFGRNWILRGLDLRIEPGQAVAVMGANGAGKTTLLRIAATLLRPLRGNGRVEGLGLLDEEDRIREVVGVLGHSPALYEDLTPTENLRFSLLMRGMEPDPDRIREILSEVALDEHAHTRVRRFSAGMRRRAALARILAGLPRLLLMDEPYASLDRDGVALVNRVIGQVKESGGGVVLATHDLHSGAEITDRVLTLAQGVVHEGLESAESTSLPDGNPQR